MTRHSLEMILVALESRIEHYAEAVQALADGQATLGAAQDIIDTIQDPDVIRRILADLRSAEAEVWSEWNKSLSKKGR